MNSAVRNAIIGLAFLLTLVAAVLYFLSTQNETTNYDGVSTTLQGLRILDQQWTSEAANVKSNPQANIDSLASFVPRIESLQSKLLKTLNSTSDVPDDLSNRLLAYSNELDSKAKRLERFKTSHEVLRNSVKFLPLATQKASLAARKRDNLTAATQLEKLEASISQYVIMPDEAKRNVLNLQIKRFESRLAASPDGLHQDEISFISHARVILDKKATTEKTYLLATSADTTATATSLLQDIDDIRTVHAKKKDAYSKGLLGTIGLLVLTALASLFVKNNVPATGDSRSKTAYHSPSSELPNWESSPEDAETFATQDRDAIESNARIKALANIASDEMEIASKTIKSNLLQIQSVKNELTQKLEETKTRMLSSTKGWSPSDVNFWMSDLVSQSRLDSLPQLLKEVDDQASSVTAIAQSLSTHTIEDIKTDYKLVNLAHCIDHMIQVTGLDQVTQVTKNYEEAPAIFASEAEILIIFRSLFEYSIESIEKASHSNGIIHINLVGSADSVAVTIQDNGLGIDPTTRRRVLAFMLRENGAMSGIDSNLKLIRLFTSKYKGRVILNSALRKGTIVKITFPVEEQTATLEEVQATTTEVDDETQINDLIEVEADPELSLDDTPTSVSGESGSVADVEPDHESNTDSVPLLKNAQS